MWTLYQRGLDTRQSPIQRRAGDGRQTCSGRSRRDASRSTAGLRPDQHQADEVRRTARRAGARCRRQDRRSRLPDRDHGRIFSGIGGRPAPRLRRAMCNELDQQIRQVAQRSAKGVVHPLAQGVCCDLGRQTPYKAAQRLRTMALQSVEVLELRDNPRTTLRRLSSTARTPKSPLRKLSRTTPGSQIYRGSTSATSPRSKPLKSPAPPLLPASPDRCAVPRVPRPKRRTTIHRAPV